MLTILHVNNTTRRYTDFHIYSIKLLLAIHHKDVVMLLYFFQMKINKPEFCCCTGKLDAVLPLKITGKELLKKTRKEVKETR